MLIQKLPLCSTYLRNVLQVYSRVGKKIGLQAISGKHGTVLAQHYPIFYQVQIHVLWEFGKICNISFLLLPKTNLENKEKHFWSIDVQNWWHKIYRELYR